MDHKTFFDAQKIISSGLIPNVSGGVSYSGYVQGDEGGTGTKKATHDGTPGEGSAHAGKGGSLMKYVSVGITVPDLSTTGSFTGFGATGNDLTSSASSPFVTLSSDFTNSVLAEIPGLDVLTALPFFNNDYSLNLGGQSVELGFHIADVYGDLNVGAGLAYDFAPTPQVYLDLTSPADGYPQTLGPFSLDAASGSLRNPPTLTMPDNNLPLTVTPRVVLNASTLQTTGTFTFGGDLSVNPLSLSYSFGGSSFSTDPLFGFPLTTSFSVPLYTYTKSFPVNSFQASLAGRPFTLFPAASPNPLIDAVSPASASVGSGDVPIALTTERANSDGEVAWDYDGVSTDPATDLSSRAFLSGLSETATIPASLLTAQGQHTLTLLNRDDSSGSVYASNPVHLHGERARSDPDRPGRPVGDDGRRGLHPRRVRLELLPARGPGEWRDGLSRLGRLLERSSARDHL